MGAFYSPNLDGVMPGSVKVQDSIWTLEAGETVVVTLEKVTPTWWASVVEVGGRRRGEAERGTRRVRGAAADGASSPLPLVPDDRVIRRSTRPW